MHSSSSSSSESIHREMGPIYFLIEYIDQYSFPELPLLETGVDSTTCNHQSLSQYRAAFQLIKVTVYRNYSHFND